MKDLCSLIVFVVVLMTIVFVSVTLHYSWQLNEGKTLSASETRTMLVVGVVTLVTLAMTSVYLLFVIFSV